MKHCTPDCKRICIKSGGYYCGGAAVSEGNLCRFEKFAPTRFERDLLEIIYDMPKDGLRRFAEILKEMSNE